MEESDKSDDLLLEVNITLSEGTTDCIKIYKGDNVHELVSNFCKTHCLPNATRDDLIRKIEDSIGESQASSSSADITDDESSCSFARPVHKLPNRVYRENNCGTALYERGLRQRERLEEKRRRLNELKEEMETKLNTFRPRINKNTTPEKGNITARLIEGGISNERKREKQRTRNVISSSQQFNFTPKISKRLLTQIM